MSNELKCADYSDTTFPEITRAGKVWKECGAGALAQIGAHNLTSGKIY